MKKFFLIALAVLLGVVVLFAGFVAFRFHSLEQQTFTRPQFTIHEEVAKASPELGQRIFGVRAGCVDCHGANLAGAVVIDAFPMGSVHGANLTPANLASWSDEEIAAAIRYGVHRTGRSLRFMPSFDYAGLSKGDVAALIAYLRTVPSVPVTEQENKYGPLARVLSVMGQMPVMFPALSVDPASPFAEKPAEAADAAFGEYLSRSCAGCHGPEFRGGKVPGGDPSWPAASPIRLGSEPAVWTKESFTQTIRTGVSPHTQQPLRPPMPVAMLQHLSETEISALWEFLHSLK